MKCLADFVLEFFLPKDCRDPEEQKQMHNSLCIVIQQACWSLHVDVDKELEEKIIFPIREPVIGSDGGLHKEETQRLLSSPTEEPSGQESSWIAHMIEAQQKGNGASVSLDYQKKNIRQPIGITLRGAYTVDRYFQNLGSFIKVLDHMEMLRVVQTLILLVGAAHQVAEKPVRRGGQRQRKQSACQLFGNISQGA